MLLRKTPGYLLIAGCLFLLTSSFSVNSNGKAKDTGQPGKDNYDISFYHLNLDVSDTSTYIQGYVTIRLKPVVALLEQVVLDFSDLLVLDSVTVNNRRQTYSRSADELTVNLDEPAVSNETISLDVYYRGPDNDVYIPSGIYNKHVLSWNKDVTWTLSEPFSAKYWFPCKQSLTDKADSVYVFLSTDKGLKAGSNGLLTASVPLAGNRIRYEWKSRYPIAYYLISFTVSDYMDYSFYVRTGDTQDSILIQNYIYNHPDYLEQNKDLIDRSAELIMLYSNLFGPYPFATEKYGHCVAPFGGGMEHQTMTTLVNFSFLLVAHEMAHQWFGDYVTCSTWQDIWINEGFASYSEYLAYEYLGNEGDAGRWIRGTHDYVKSSSGGSLYVPEEFAGDEDRIFDSRLSYKKGAAIIHMIRQEVGNDSLFFKTLTGFIQKYGNGNASGDDFRNYLEESTRIDFSRFFDQWYYGQGFPVHYVTWDYQGDTLYISSLQTVTSETPVFNVLLEFKVNQNAGDTLLSMRQTASFVTSAYYLPGGINSVETDPHNWLLFEIAGSNYAGTPEAETKFRIIPNPAKERIKVLLSNISGNSALHLVDVNGRIVLTQHKLTCDNEIDISSYAPGMYFVIIRDMNNLYSGKFIIN
ncbi:MAG: T9SS type A sorting domain-containing protein [Bacteroidales bacterium]|nr:T9SS type A sorting domain-containing protein [Bacteroidales bacterium]